MKSGMLHPNMANSDMAPHTIKLSAVICTFNRYELLQGAITSLAAQRNRGQMELLIIDNSPDAERAAQFAQIYAKEDWIAFTHQEPPGLSLARNRGLALARGPIIAYLDDDVIVHQGWLAAMIEAFTNPGSFRPGAVAGRVDIKWEGQRPHWLGPAVIGYLGALNLGPNMRGLDPAEHIIGCNMAFNRAALAEIGGFSNVLGRDGRNLGLLSNEELEVANKLQAKGYDRVYVPEAVVDHVVATERLTQTWFRKRAAWQAVSDLLMTPPEAEPALRQGVFERLGRRGMLRSKAECLSFISDKDSAQAQDQDQDFVYDVVMGVLLGGQPPKRQRLRSRLLGLLRRI